MISVREMAEHTGLTIIHDADLDRPVSGGYASDLLSCVMAGARENFVWVTLQAHPNVVAVAALVGLSAVIITEGIQPDQETVRKAQDEGLNLFGSAENTFNLVGRLAALGI